MPDRDKVIKELECCSQMSGYVCQKCPYASDCKDMHAGVPHLASDALELLKEQQKTISSFQGTIRKLNAALEEQPDIVRCKDCKYGELLKNAKGEPTIECSLYNEEWWLKEPDWFCADGKRR